VTGSRPGGQRGQGSGPGRSAAGPRLVAAAVLAFLLFDYPVLAVFGSGGSVGGLPLLVVYVFAAWAAVVALAARYSRGS
jgi:hypothetical protein